MTCKELERVLPELEGVRSFELEQHLRTCSECAALVSDLNAISAQSRLLQTVEEEPSARLWASIESTLRQEGLIHEARPQLVSVAPRAPRWRFPWLMPAMATFLVVCGLVLYQRGGLEPAPASQPVAKVSPADQASAMVPEEEEVLKLVGARVPALRATYESDLKAVDAYIVDAERSARTNPNDEIAQQYLMNAYEQKAMVYELAMDRSQP